MLPTINLNRQQIGLKTYHYVTFSFNREIYKILTNIPGAVWDKSTRAFRIDEEILSKQSLLDYLKDKANVTFNQFILPSIEDRKAHLRPSDWLEPLNKEQQRAIQEFQRYLHSKRYSEKTVRVYSDSLSIFLRYTSSKAIEEIDNNDLIDFNNNYILKNGYSSSFQNQVVNAIKLFYCVIHKHKLEVELIHRPRPEKKMPNVLSKEEVKRLLEAPTNLKHKAMLSLIYACGLRRGELLNLTIKDIHSERKLLLIRQAKGKKDRVVPLSDKILKMLREYYKLFKPKVWLFEGSIEQKRYSEKSLENVLKQSKLKAKIEKPVTLHWLRHSYATHLLENGTDLRYIQELLGHKSSRTTEIYTHVSIRNIQQIKSPFDDL